MAMLDSKIDIPTVESLLGKVARYPVTNHELVDLAEQLNTPESVTHFFASIPGTLDFDSREDIMDRVYESNLLIQEEIDNLRYNQHEYVIEED